MSCSFRISIIAMRKRGGSLHVLEEVLGPLEYVGTLQESLVVGVGFRGLIFPWHRVFVGLSCSRGKRCVFDWS